MGPPVLVVPGWTNAGPDHWLSLWQRTHPDWQRVEQSDWDRPDPGDWIATLDGAVRRASSPPLLLAHSLGALTVVKWAAAYPTVRAAGALLVAPADVERDGGPPELRPFAPIPMVRIPFPAIVVASRTDPYVAWDRAVAFAAAWGARIHDAGDAGHIDTDAGYGPWPEGERLVAKLMGDGEVNGR